MLKIQQCNSWQAMLMQYQNCYLLELIKNIPLISKSEKQEEGYFQAKLHLLTISTCELTQTPKSLQTGGPQHFQKKRQAKAMPSPSPPSGMLQQGLE